MRERDDFSTEEESEINLTPMLDVVFIMLIFFIVTAVFVKEPGVEVTRPEAVMAIAPEGGAIFVAVTSNDEVWIDRRQIDPTAVRVAIERMHSENPESGVIIQADNGAHNALLIEVMDAAKAAGVDNITIAATVQ